MALLIIVTKFTIIDSCERPGYTSGNSATWKSSHQRCSIKKNNVLQACNFIKQRLQHRRFIVNIAKFLKIPFLKIICERLLLKMKNLEKLQHAKSATGKECKMKTLQRVKVQPQVAITCSKLTIETLEQDC